MGSGTVAKKARKLGKKHSPDDVCQHCARTPNGKRPDDEAIISRLKKISGYEFDNNNDLVPPSMKQQRLYAKVAVEAFREGYSSELPGPEECKVCSGQFTECFHERYGLEGLCPYLTRSETSYY